ncbi:MAG: hypothetical protein Q8Q35_03670 [Nanoarchaeota archaeon]|nr:hypothetical protein [Nanoarchaeota archaeon]
MAEFTIIEENPICLTDIKQKLKLIEKEGKLSFRAEKTKAYLDNFATLTKKDNDKVKKEIENLNIPRLKDRHIIKIIDVLPKDADSLKILLSGETLTISDEDIKKILDVIPQ